MKTLFVLLGCYLVGSISGAYLLSRGFRHKDIRDEGSGNAGTTNAIRVMGKKLGYATFAIDVLKGVVAMLVLAPMLQESIRLFAGVFVVLGHDFPFYLGFRGGKGIATTFGSWGALEPLYVAIAAIAGVLAGKATKYVSVGSLTFLTVISAAMLVVHNHEPANGIAVLVVWILGFIRHKENLIRIKEGRENKIGGR
ncbi:MAG: glycerol-3-phosphate 1-O-acyltransferase PlsY [Peptoniphilus sp.]|nr:glycerol-3-phosphate 1-O-acyltransferase PlsY [Peptoniphilus sp.]MDY3118025.1 glycerol-3-phosphate 1-O-acyltransferase PlsY [Peptoniphilus sp.]